MSEVALKAETRLATGKGVARKLRASGKVPATVYGHGAQPIGVAVDAKELGYLLSHSGKNALIALDVDGTKHLALAREIQRNPIRNEIWHVDFMTVSRDQEVTVDIPIHWVGKAPGEREGGIVEHVHAMLHARARATSVPESIEVDISDLGLDKPLTVADITVPEGVTLLLGADEVVATCTLPREEVEEADTTAPEEPEVIGGTPEEAPAE
jgi:large subunit ribosomal protein L25